MKLRLLPVLASCASLILSSFAVQAQMIIPMIGGTATGSAFEEFDTAFDSQPAAVPTAGVTTDEFGVDININTSSGRGVFLDFGINYATLTVNQIYAGLKATGTNPTGITGTATYFWSNDSGVAFDAGTDTLAPDLNLFNFTATNSSKRWELIYNNPTGLVPAARYYVIRFGGSGGAGNRIQEYVFVTTVPETSAACLGLLGGGMLLFRRRRK